MEAASWKPGTARWAYLITGVYGVFLVVGLPLTIVVNTDSGWVLFSILMIGGMGNTAAAWLACRHPRRTTAPAADPAPQR